MNSNLGALTTRQLYREISRARALAHGAEEENARRRARTELIELDAELWRRLTPADDDIPYRRS